MNLRNLILFLFPVLLILGIVYACNTLTEDVGESLETTIVMERGNTPYDILDLLGVDCLIQPDPNNPAGCFDEEFTETLVINDLPGYPGCSFTVEYNYLTCLFGGILQIQTGDYQIIDHDCLKFSNDISDSNMSEADWNDYISDFDIQVKDIIAEYMIEKFFDEEIFKCGEGVFLSVEVYASACYMYYITPISTVQQYDNLNGGISDDRNNLNTALKVTCGTVCCEYTYKVCVDENGNQVITEIPGQTPTSCGGDPIVNVPVGIKEGTILEKGCTINCNY